MAAGGGLDSFLGVEEEGEGIFQQHQREECKGMPLAGMAISAGFVVYGFSRHKRLAKGFLNFQVKDKFGCSAPSGLGEGDKQHHPRETEQMRPVVR